MNNMEYGKIYARYIAHKLINDLYPETSLKRAKKYGIIKRIDPKIKRGECDITPYLKYGEYNDVVLSFIKTFEEKLPHCSKKFFYNKIKTLKIKEKRKSYDDAPEGIDIKIHGIHNVIKNDINIYIHSKVDDATETLYNISVKKYDTATHELLHFASSVKKGVVLFSGFSQEIKNEYCYGVGLNEGYTELLNIRYFSQEKIKKYGKQSYSNQQIIALGIEEIVGREKMESLYFEANLEGLVEELCKYTTKEHVISLIDKIDHCHNSESDEEEYNNLAEEIRSEIANIQNVKNKQLLKMGKITQEEFEFNELKNKFYKVGEILEKSSDDYSFRYYDNYNEKKLSSEAYRVLKNTAKQIDNASDLVICAYKLNTAQFIDNIDLTNIETIELTNEEENGYKLIEKTIENSDESTSDELTAMLTDTKEPSLTSLLKKSKS